MATDNFLFSLIIPLIQQGMNAILAANYNLLATQSGNVITTEGGSGIEADTVVVPEHGIAYGKALFNRVPNRR
jgi:hypothetical protein